MNSHIIINQNGIFLFNDDFNKKLTNSIYEIVCKKIEEKSKEIKKIGSVVIFFTEEDDSDKKLIEFFEEINPHPFFIFITSCEKKNKVYYNSYIKENELDFDEENIYIIQKKTPAF